eukprot:GFUD01010129.1.p1 GENE.GFUD01010129.1~~GFUD01010129.1.p1  ORF type:complete len:355 (-),score=115.92 GFUD01010129.1:103-1167(-)
MVEELCQFLTPNNRIDVRAVALAEILGLTGTPEGLLALSSVQSIHSSLISLVTDSSEVIATDACFALINLSSDPACVKSLLGLPSLVSTLHKVIADKESKLADKATQVLSNLTRDLASCGQVHGQLQKAGIGVDSLVSLLCQEGYNLAGQDLRFLGPVLSNLSQLQVVRKEILEPEKCVIQRLLPFTEYSKSIVKRGGVVGTIRNCCFDTEHHEWLLGPDVDIVPRLLLPLAGPTPEDLADDDIEKLPVDLQYLDEDKTIEPDVDIRTMLLEGLAQLCATKASREVLREKNVYVVLRQFHKVEKDRACLLAAENIVDILIKTEDEINIDNYKEVEVPDDVVDKLKKMDECYLND